MINKTFCDFIENIKIKFLNYYFNKLFNYQYSVLKEHKTLITCQ